MIDILPARTRSSQVRSQLNLQQSHVACVVALLCRSSTAIVGRATEVPVTEMGMTKIEITSDPSRSARRTGVVSFWFAADMIPLGSWLDQQRPMSGGSDRTPIVEDAARADRRRSAASAWSAASVVQSTIMLCSEY